MISKFTVAGMTCEHCEGRVQAEFLLLESVSTASADFRTGTVTVASDVPLAAEIVAAAVEEAGYVLDND